MPYISFSPPREALLSKASLASGRRVGYFLAVVGIVCLGIGDYLFSRERMFLNHAGHSTARVVEVQPRRTRMGLGYHPVFAYADGTGKEWRLVSSESTTSSAVDAKQTAEVFYTPDDPGRGQLEGFAGRWGLALAFGIAGAVLGLVGYIGTGVFEWIERTSRFP